MSDDYGHVPVLLNEVIESLRLKPGDVIVDCTVGCGGHAEAILEKICPGGKLIGIDRDENALNITRKRLERFGDAVVLLKENYKNLASLRGSNISSIDGILLDLGVSSVQLDTPNRGFSFKGSNVLDMRMDETQELDAKYVVNKYPEKELADLIWQFGDERRSRKIARYIVRCRDKKEINTTDELATIVAKAYGFNKKKPKTHPATRTFQALRIYVNKELDCLRQFLESVMSVLNNKAGVCVISYHSLEDRIVKHEFKKLASTKEVELLTKKPIVPSREEVLANRRARSAKMRVAYRVF